MTANEATENRWALTSLLPLWGCIRSLVWWAFPFLPHPPPEPRHSIPFIEHPSSLLSHSLPFPGHVHRPANSSQDTGFYHVFLCLQMSLWSLDQARPPLRHSKYLWSFLQNVSTKLSDYVIHHSRAPGKEALCLSYSKHSLSQTLSPPGQAALESCAGSALHNLKRGYSYTTTTGRQPCAWTPLSNNFQFKTCEN